jgi:biopolymer transport protein ExbB
MDLTKFFLRFALLGANWVLWLLTALSIVSVTIMIERMLFFRARGIDIHRFADDLRGALSSGNIPLAWQLVRNSRAPECAVIAAGLDELPRGVHAVSEAMLSAKARERMRLEAYLPILGTLGNNAAFIGLFGTVLGIIKASHDLSLAQAAQNTVAAAVMGGVFEALVATAVGLFVAIPAVVAYNTFQRRVNATLGRIDFVAHLLLSQMEPDPAAHNSPLPESARVTDGH